MAEKIDIVVPDLGVDGEVDVIEIAVAVGDVIDIDSPLMTLESDKASMDVPSSNAGTVTELKVKVGDKVKTGDVILSLAAEAGAVKPEVQPAAEAPVEKTPEPKVEVAPEPAAEKIDGVFAGPSVRRLARELGIDLASITGSGHKGRITRDDLNQRIKSSMQGSGGGIAVPAAPVVDFSVFGEIETAPLSKIKKLSGSFLHRNWLQVPHITQFDDADITELEAFRRASKKEAEAQGCKLTPLVFIMKAVVSTLKKFPEVNASLSPDGGSLILKKYYNIGVAVDTPNGLVVPVIRDVDKKGLYALAQELRAISEKARTKGLGMSDMQGGCFTISSLGGIGGTAFTPIVNVPEVAILGVSRSSMKPVYQDGQFVPRLMLPLSLSYDHRVIDGAQGARFITYLSSMLSDVRNLLL